MKIVLLGLSGDRSLARKWLLKSYPGTDVENISRDQLESQPPLERIRMVRSRHPDALAIATERLVCMRCSSVAARTAGRRERVFRLAHKTV